MGFNAIGQNRIAVVDDDAHIRETVCDILSSEQFTPVGLANASDFMAHIARGETFDLVVLDLHLPDRDGFSVTASVRAISDIPIIILTARSGDIDRIMGLEIGADDYVVKPFNPRELLARIKAVRRRTLSGTTQRPPTSYTVTHGFRFDELTIDTDRRRLLDRTGSQVLLTVAEFDLLLALVRNACKVLSREQLLDLTHQYNDEIYDRTIDVLILRLRRKIEKNPAKPHIIRTERGIGYVFDCAAEPI